MSSALDRDAHADGTTRGRVFVMHGVVEALDRRDFTHLGLRDRDAFARYLQQRATPFAPLESALASGGDALTIDDATRASADAALVARRLGHAVTLFVTPSYIARGLPYWFHLLTTVLGRARASRVAWADRVFDLTRSSERAVLRGLLKPHLQGLADDDARFAWLERWRTRCEVEDMSLPTALRTLSSDDIGALLAAGVDVQNHGWTHADGRRLSVGEQRHEIVKGREWLTANYRIRPYAYAAPFGMTRPSAVLRATLDELWLCAHDDWGPGRLEPGVWNRVSLFI